MTDHLTRDQAFTRLTRDCHVCDGEASDALTAAADPGRGAYLLPLPPVRMAGTASVIQQPPLLISTARGREGRLRFIISGAPAVPADPAEADALAMNQVRQALQGYIGDATPREERTAMWSVDGAAYYLVTPGQRKILQAAAPERIRAMNERSPHGEYTDPRGWLRALSGERDEPGQAQDLSWLPGFSDPEEELAAALPVPGYQPDGTFMIVDSVHPEEFADEPSDRSELPRDQDGHSLARKQIATHGRDRYPTVGAQYAKLLDELGELGEALIEKSGGGPEEVEREYADAGLSLYALGNKLGLDLIECMRKLVSNDTRSFRD